MSQPSEPPDAAAYRPLSGWAIAGFGLAAFSALGIGTFAVVALVSGSPLLLDSTLGALMFLALTAFVLSLVGWLQVARDEGIRAGQSLARWGMVVSALFGLGYLSWSVAKELAVSHESRGFTDDWLDRLRRDKPGSLDGYIAFWHLLPPDGRAPQFPLHDPRFEKQLRSQAAPTQELVKYIHTNHAYGATEQQRAMFPGFWQHDLIQLLSQAGAKATIEPTGVRSWTYRGKTQGGFHVEHNYQITTAEGIFPIVVSVLSSEMLDGRLWQVLLEGTAVDSTRHLQLTPLGQNVMTLRMDSREFARDWVRKLSQGLREEAFLDTLPAPERPALRSQAQIGQRCATAIAAASGAGGLCPLLLTGPSMVDVEAARLLYLPGFATFAAGRLVNDEALIADPSVRPGIGRELRRLFGPVQPTAVFWPTVADSDSRIASPWQLTQRDTIPELVFGQPFSLRIPPNLFCEGMVHVATTDPALAAAVMSPGGDPLKVSVAQMPLRWRIRGLELTFGTIVVRDEGK